MFSLTRLRFPINYKYLINNSKLKILIQQFCLKFFLNQLLLEYSILGSFPFQSLNNILIRNIIHLFLKKSDTEISK